MSAAAAQVAAAYPLHSASAAQSAAYYNKSAFEKDGMQYCRLGTTGAVVSRIALGLMSYASVQAGDAAWQDWLLANEAGDAFLQQALECGINFFDTAEIYSEGRSELWFGAALKKLLGASRFTREDLIISTKIYPTRTMNPNSAFGGLQKGLSRKAIFAAVEGSLARLQTDYIDLYFIHRFDPNTSVEETMRALHDLVVAGKVRYIGASSMFTWQFNKLQQAAERNGWTKFAVMQNHYNAIYRYERETRRRGSGTQVRGVYSMHPAIDCVCFVCVFVVREEEREMIPYCVESGVACTPYSPLASGVLTRPKATGGDSKRAETDKAQRVKYYKSGDDEVSAAVQAIASERKIPAAQVALAWLLQKPGVTTPIIGATKAHHIPDAVAALKVQLSAEEIARIEKDYQPHAVSGHS